MNNAFLEWNRHIKSLFPLTHLLLLPFIKLKKMKTDDSNWCTANADIVIFLPSLVPACRFNIQLGKSSRGLLKNSFCIIMKKKFAFYTLLQ